jgi:prepilin-type N-terminal cleavage/methylation domain-containing protein
MPQARSNSSRGFSLTEVIIAMGILTTVSLGVAQVFALTARANHVARGQTSTISMAEQKLEQIRSLTWGYDTAGQGLPITDTTTDLAAEPTSTGGAGLNPSPVASLTANTAGYVDYLDANGAYVGTGTTVPTGTVYVRRWSIQPLPTNPNNTLILQVFVTPLSNEVLRNPTTAFHRMAGDALLVSVKTRKAQ